MQNINYTNNLIDRNMDKIEALDNRNDNINSKLNNNISEINDLLKEINEKLLSGTLDHDERMVYELQLQEISGCVTNINSKVEVINVAEKRLPDNQMDKMDENENE